MLYLGSCRKNCCSILQKTSTGQSLGKIVHQSYIGGQTIDYRFGHNTSKIRKQDLDPDECNFTHSCGQNELGYA